MNRFQNNQKITDWVSAPLDELIEHIINVHHAYLDENLPDLSGLIEEILRLYGTRYPELLRVNQLFHQLQTGRERHLLKEETVLYPAIREYVQSGETKDLQKAIGIIRSLQDENTEAGNLLKEMRTITDGYSCGEGCNSCQTAYRKLQETETDISTQIHLENNILFPRLFAKNEEKCEYCSIH